MKEPTNIVINIRITQRQWDYLRKKENISQYVRNLVANDIKQKKIYKNKTL